MFGLAYFDLRDKTLWLARDRLGIKPLYVTCPGQSVIFASEIKSLLAHPKVPMQPDLHSLTTHMIRPGFEGRYTPFEGIEQLLPGTLWKINERSVNKMVYFDLLRDLDVDRLLSTDQDPSEKLAHEFESAMAESVRIHLASDAPLAAMCSGGIDSSLITAFAKEHQPNLVGYVADVDGASEGDVARYMGRHLGVPIRQEDIDCADYLKLWPKSVWHLDTPTIHSHDMPFFAVCRLCQKDGIKVLLTGEGSDEMFGGYRIMRKTHRLWRSRRRRHRLTPNLKMFQKLARRFPALFPLNLMMNYGSYPLNHSPDLFAGSRRDQLIRRACALDGDHDLLSEEIFAKLAPIKPLENRAFLTHCLYSCHGLLQSLLHRNDRLAMAASLESRVPFVENKLIDLAMHFPTKVKLHRGIDKWVVRQASVGRLPEQTVRGPKTAFKVNFNFFRHAAGVLEDGMVADLFRWSSKAKARLISKVLPVNAATCHLVGIELWARVFLRGENPDELGEKLAGAQRE